MMGQIRTLSLKLGHYSIEIGEGSDQIRLDMGVDKAIEVASTIMVAILPAAMRDGFAVESLGNRFFLLLAEKCQTALAQTDAMPS